MIIGVIEVNNLLSSNLFGDTRTKKRSQVDLATHYFERYVRSVRRLHAKKQPEKLF